MGTCISIIEQDDDPYEKEIKIKNKQKAKELHEFANQLRKQKCHSQLDLNGKVDTRPRHERVGS